MDLDTLIDTLREIHELYEDMERVDGGNTSLGILDLYYPEDLIKIAEDMGEIGDGANRSIEEGMLDATTEAEEFVQNHKNDPQYEDRDGFNWLDKAHNRIMEAMGGIREYLESAAFDAEDILNSESRDNEFMGYVVSEEEVPAIQAAWDVFLNKYGI